MQKVKLKTERAKERDVKTRKETFGKIIEFLPTNSVQFVIFFFQSHMVFVKKKP